jgi:oxygen-independent coproporphyrinogen-3 oxidase
VAGVYVSFPFCAQKCAFCNFASGVFPRDLEQRYLGALESELAAFAWPWRPETVYLGGGSPNRIAAPALAALLDRIPGRPWREATIEATPGAVTPDLARAWRDAGIDRVSLGVQSFVPSEIAATGRKHTPARVAEEVAVLRDAGIVNFNLDLIAGLPGQTPATWCESLDWIERLGAPHVSVYMLEIDEDSRLGAEILRGGARYGASKAPSDDLVADLYETAVDRLASLGIERYEISNFARPGFESRHNLKYWTLEPYAAFGADAHSFDGVWRRANVESPADYVDRVERGLSPSASVEAAHPDQERFFVGLRLLGGVDLCPGDWQRFEAPIRRFIQDGLLEIVPGSPAPTERRPSGSSVSPTEPRPSGSGVSPAEPRPSGSGVSPAEPRPSGSGRGTLRLTRRGVLLSNEIFQEFLES